MADEKIKPDLADLLFSVATRLRGRLDAAWSADEAAAIGLTGGRALLWLEGGGTQLTALATHLGMTKQAASEIVDKLIAAGLVDKQPDPRDGRARKLAPTRRGKIVLVRYSAMLEDIGAPLLEGLGSKKSDRLLRYLAALERTLRSERSGKGD